MYSFKFRIHYGTQYDALIKALTKLLGKCTRMIVYDHRNDGAERPHIHGLVMLCTVGEKQFKDGISKGGCKFKGQAEWSFSSTYDDASGNEVSVNDNYIVYMTKGKYDPVIQFGYMDDEIMEYKKKWIPKAQWDIANGRLGISGDTPPTKKLTKREVIREVDIMLKKNNVFTDSAIRDAIKAVLIKDSQCLGLYKVLDIYDAYNMYYNQVKFDIHFENALLRRERN